MLFFLKYCNYYNEPSLSMFIIISYRYMFINHESSLCRFQSKEQMNSIMKVSPFTVCLLYFSVQKISPQGPAFAGIWQLVCPKDPGCACQWWNACCWQGRQCWTDQRTEVSLIKTTKGKNAPVLAQHRYTEKSKISEGSTTTILN